MNSKPKKDTKELRLELQDLLRKIVLEAKTTSTYVNRLSTVIKENELPKWIN